MGVHAKFLALCGHFDIAIMEWLAIIAEEGSVDEETQFLVLLR